jgi:hypothetical protein
MSNNSTHLIVYAVTKFEDQHGQEQSRWTRIGVMFPNAKSGFQIKLELLPANGKADIVAMPPRAKEDE